MRRILFRGNNITHLDRSDQLHCRLIFQPKGVVEPAWPMVDDPGHIVWPGGRKLDTRVYTIRKADVARGEVIIDFALHSTPGPATAWARTAKPGDIVGIVGPAAGGPRRSGYYVLAGDETGLPGIARILEWMDDDAAGVAFIEVNGPEDEQPFHHPSNIDLCWLHRNGAPAGTTPLLVDAVCSVDWPDDMDQVFFWGGCEHKAFRAIHRMLRNDVRLPRNRMVLYSHWHRNLSEEQIIEIGGEAYLPE